MTLVLCGTLPDWNVSRAANHREAPLTALDPKADITDFYAFVSYDDPNKVTFILAVDPLLEPANGPNYFPFGPDVRYSVKIDNDNDAKTSALNSASTPSSACPVCLQALSEPVTGSSRPPMHRRI